MYDSHKTDVLFTFIIKCIITEIFLQLRIGGYALSIHYLYLQHSKQCTESEHNFF